MDQLIVLVPNYHSALLSNKLRQVSIYPNIGKSLRIPTTSELHLQSLLQPRSFNQQNVIKARPLGGREHTFEGVAANYYLFNCCWCCGRNAFYLLVIQRVQTKVKLKLAQFMTLRECQTLGIYEITDINPNSRNTVDCTYFRVYWV